MKKDYTEIMLVIDNSQSMKTICEEAESGLNDLIKTQKNLPGKCKVSVINFSTNVQRKLGGVDIDDLEKLKIVPAGLTAMLDAIGTGINDLGQRLANMKESERPEHVIFAIVTDGQENNSKEFTNQQIRDMIKHQTDKYSWEFIFLGCGDDALKQAETIAISAQNTMKYTHSNVGTRTAYNSVTNKMSSIRTKCAYDMSKDNMD